MEEFNSSEDKMEGLVAQHDKTTSQIIANTMIEPTVGAQVE